MVYLATCTVQHFCSVGVCYLSVSVTFREAPPHHVGHTEGFDSQQVEDHSVGQSELGLEDSGLTLSQTKRRTPVIFQYVAITDIF